MDDSQRLKMQSSKENEGNVAKQESQSKGTDSLKDRYCFFCKSPSHFIKNCPKMNSSDKGKKVVSAAGFPESDVGHSFRGGQRGGRRGIGGPETKVGVVTITVIILGCLLQMRPVKSNQNLL